MLATLSPRLHKEGCNGRCSALSTLARLQKQHFIMACLKYVLNAGTTYRNILHFESQFSQEVCYEILRVYEKFLKRNTTIGLTFLF